jgi:hypothetical protein
MRESESAADARAALAQADAAGTMAARAGKRSARRTLLAMAIATALAVLGSWLIIRRLIPDPGWWRSVAVGAVWVAAFGATLVLLTARQPVRAIDAKRTMVTVLSSSAVTGVTMAIGFERPIAYVVAAACAVGIGVAGHVWARR